MVALEIIQKELPMIKVLHNKRAFDGTFGIKLAFAGNEIVNIVGNQPLSDFVHVANVKTDDLEHAFQQTNQIDQPCTENSDVEVIKRARSTSISDIMERNGKFFVVASCGFLEVKLSGG